MLTKDERAALDLLKRGRKRLSRLWGWTKRAYWRGLPGTPLASYCMLGSLGMGTSHPQCMPQYIAAKALEKLLPPGVGIISYNDHPDTTKEGVLKKFDTAIACFEKADRR